MWKMEKNMPSGEACLFQSQSTWEFFEVSKRCCPLWVDILKLVIERECSSFDGTKLLDLCHSMPSRLWAMIEANGRHTYR